MTEQKINWKKVSKFVTQFSDTSTVVNVSVGKFLQHYKDKSDLPLMVKYSQYKKWVMTDETIGLLYDNINNPDYKIPYNMLPVNTSLTIVPTDQVKTPFDTGISASIIAGGTALFCKKVPRQRPLFVAWSVGLGVYLYCKKIEQIFKNN